MKTQIEIAPEVKNVIIAGSISEIARLIRRNWSKVYFGAVPYLDAMGSLNSVKDNFGNDSGREIVNYFLANATTWKGPVAREVKKELNARVKAR